jgi:hypothetical protein
MRMMTRAGLAALMLAVAACAAQSATAPAARDEAVSFEPATPEQGAAILSASDEYLTVLTPADLSIRLRGEPGDAGDLARLYARGTRAWSAAERDRLEQMVARHRADLNPLAPWLPDTVYFIKGTRDIESAIPHTRGDAIFFGDNLPDTQEGLDGLFFHELFHVLSRANRNRADEIYGIIGFQRCEAVLPATITDRMLTNPDAPRVLHAAPIAENDPTLFATPILVADPSRYTPSRANMAQYFGVEITPMRRGADGRCRPDASVTLTQNQMQEAIFAHAGRNTNYMFHPEELMADNFSQMMMGQSVADPWVHERLAALLGINPPGRR